MKQFQQCPWSIGTQNFEVEFAIFLEHLREYERFYQIEEAQNAFLDAYSAWRKQPKDRAMNPALKGGVKAHLIWCAAYLSYLDPTFRGPRALRRYYTPTPIDSLGSIQRTGTI